jgi:hypothetical protein
MAALTGERYTTRYKDPADGTHGGGVKASSKIWKGAIVVRDASGFLVKGTTATGLLVMGVARETVDNTGANGAQTIQLDTGAFEFENSSAGDLIAATDIGNDVFIVDDQTVAKTNGTNTRSRAGKCVGIAANGKPIVRIAVGF